VIDRKIGIDSVNLIRMRNKDGSFLFSGEECLRYIEVLMDRSKKPPEGKPGGRNPAGSGSVYIWKPTGRGKLFWTDSE
jgi:hypothetical protein